MTTMFDDSRSSNSTVDDDNNCNKLRSISSIEIVDDQQRLSTNDQIINNETKPPFIGYICEKADDDWKIANLCSKVGKMGYNFFVYYIGGRQRTEWTPTEDESVPDIDLPDLQMKPGEWSRFVTVRCSPWIDLDSPIDWLAKKSAIALNEEIDHTVYLGVVYMIISLKHRDSPKLADFLARIQWKKQLTLRFWIVVPTDEQCLGVCQSSMDKRDIWGIWADFRSLAITTASTNRLTFALKLTANIGDEFIDDLMKSRWLSEPMGIFWLTSEVFMQTNRGDRLVISDAHARLISFIHSSNTPPTILVSTPSIVGFNQQCKYTQEIRTRFSVECNSSSISNDADYDDVLQTPLQPLADNLSSYTYSVFESDPFKYDQYRRAIESAAIVHIRSSSQLTDNNNDIVVMVLGAGRGPLVAATLRAENDVKRLFNSAKFHIYAVEKNPSAVQTINYLNVRFWNHRVNVIRSDMRNFHPDILPDIVVSELLGSFGDNELSPECLDGVNHLFKKSTTVSIPCKYTNYLAPIQSLTLRNKIISIEYKKDEPASAKFDQLYVVHLQRCLRLADPQPAFTFSHPNIAANSNERAVSLDFTVAVDCEVMGFAGYFDAQLFADFNLSIVPHRESTNMISWFPAVFPLRRTIRLNATDSIRLNIWRKIDANTSVWYEWNVEYACGESMITTDIQNVNGQSYKMWLDADAMPSDEYVNE